MNIQCLLGVHVFLYNIIKYKSFLSLVVYINGVIYYTREENQLIRYYDTICNMLIFCYYTIAKRYFDYYGICGVLCFCFNLITQTIYYDYIHIFFVQFSFAYSINNYYYTIDKVAGSTNQQHQLRYFLF